MGLSFKHWLKPALMAGAGCFMAAAGCATPPGAEGAAKPGASVHQAQPAGTQPATGQPTQSTSDKRFIIAPELAGIIQVVDVRMSKPSAGLLKFQVNVQNMTATPQRFSYRVEWFDEDGNALPQDSGEFNSWMLRSHEISIIVGTSPARTATDFGIAFVPSPN